MDKMRDSTKAIIMQRFDKRWWEVRMHANVQPLYSPCDRIPFIILVMKSKLYSMSSLQITGDRDRNVTTL